MHILSARRPIECALSPVNDSRGGLEVPIQMTFSHFSKAIIGKMKAFAENQARKMKEIFRMEEDVLFVSDVRFARIKTDNQAKGQKQSLHFGYEILFCSFQ